MKTAVAKFTFWGLHPRGAGRTQLLKRLIVGKDQAAGKVFAGKSVIFAFRGVVGSESR